jgi:integrase
LVSIFFQSGISVPHAKELTYGDIQEEYNIGTIPLCLDFTQMKHDKPYLTFIGKAGAKLLRNYLQAREKHESLEPDTPLFPISVSAIERYFNRRARKLVGYSSSILYTPGSLVASFRTLMRQAGCPAEFIHFWSGRQSRVYKVKSKESWRAEYSKFAGAVAFPVLPDRRKVRM